MVLTLYKLDASPPVRSVLMVIQAANIPDVKYVDVNLLEGDHLKEEFVKLNPQHTVPMLKDDDFVVWDRWVQKIFPCFANDTKYESNSGNSCLLTKYSNNKTLYPTDPKKRSIIDQGLHFDSGILFPALRNTIENVLFRGEKSFKPESLEKIKAAYALSEKFLTGPWMAGAEMTLADICCFATISSMNEILPIDVKFHPNIISWSNRCQEQDFYEYVQQNAPGVAQMGALVRSKIE